MDDNVIRAGIIALGLILAGYLIDLDVNITVNQCGENQEAITKETE